jgi:uncharacterized membrane protein HdeD (DUF308 family)
MTAAAHHTEPRSSTSTGAGILFVEGAVLILFGVAAIAFPLFASIAAAVLLGWILIASGIAGLIGAFTERPHLHFGWSLLSSIVSIAAGLVAAFYPLAGVLALALVIAAWLALDGVGSMMIALNLRRAGSRSWGWPAVSAIIDWVLAVGIFMLAPVGGALIVGIIVGVDLVFGGVALMMIGAALRGQARA